MRVTVNSDPRTLIGIGVYTVPEVSRLTGVGDQSIRRWVQGYRFRRDQALRAMPAVWHADLGLVDGTIALSFLDMMEVRFIQAFRQHHVSWAAIREAARLACEMFNENHPFTLGRFRTDGKRIFQQIEEQGAVRLFDMNRQSWVFHEIVSPSLYQGIEFSVDQVVRWFPMHPRRTVVVDPERSFGRPIVSRESVPTDVLAAAARAEGSIECAARWFDVSPASVRAAVAFEKRLVA